MSQTRVVDKEELLELVNATKDMSEGEFYKELNLKLQGELGELGRYIDKTRKNLRKLDTAAEAAEKIPDASAQLTDITKATEKATHKVISIAEKIMDEQVMVSQKIKELREIAASPQLDGHSILKISKEMEEISNRHTNDLMDILTALSFQDITGQKIKKIVIFVGEVETKILELLISFGKKKEPSVKREEMMTQLKKEAEKGQGVNQVLIDQIMKDFGM